jgi:hypothetical protein
MPYNIQLPDGTIIEGIPDDVSKEEARQRIIMAFPQLATPESGFIPAVKAGTSGLKEAGYALLGRTGLMDEEEAQKAIEREQRYQQVTFKPTEEGWTEAPLTKIAELGGQSLPYMAAPIAAGVGAAMLPVTGTAALLTGVGAVGAVSGAQFTGTNLLRQMETGKSIGETDLGNAALAAVPQAALDVVGLRMIPFIRGVFGKAGRDLTEEQARLIASKSIKDVAADYTLATGKAMTVEGLTEAAQQSLERLQAGLSITDEEARQEYLDSFIGGAVLGGVLAPPGRYMERRSILSQAQQPAPGAQPGVQPAAPAAPIQPGGLQGPAGPTASAIPPEEELTPEQELALQARIAAVPMEQVAQPAALAQPPAQVQPPVQEITEQPEEVEPEAPPAKPIPEAAVPQLELLNRELARIDAKRTDPMLSLDDPIFQELDAREAQIRSQIQALTEPPASVKQVEGVVGFKTAKGSTYELDQVGRSSRTKLSPGRGQGTTYPPHTVFYVTPENSRSILEDKIGGEASIRLGFQDGDMFRKIGDISELPEGATPLVAVVDRETNQIRGSYPAQTQPAVGLAPVEKLYNNDGTANTHVGNPIVELFTAKPKAPPVEEIVELPSEEDIEGALAEEVPARSADEVQKELNRARQNLNRLRTAIKQKKIPESDLSSYETRVQDLEAELAAAKPKKKAPAKVKKAEEVETEEPFGFGQPVPEYIPEELEQKVAELERARAAEPNLFRVLRGKLTPSEVNDISPDKSMSLLSAGKGKGRDLSDIVNDGDLNEFLPYNLRTDVDTFDLQEATEFIKDQLRQDQRTFPEARMTYEFRELTLPMLRKEIADIEAEMEPADANRILQEVYAEERAAIEAYEKRAPEAEERGPRVSEDAFDLQGQTPEELAELERREKTGQAAREREEAERKRAADLERDVFALQPSPGAPPPAQVSGDLFGAQGMADQPARKAAPAEPTPIEEAAQGEPTEGDVLLIEADEKDFAKALKEVEAGDPVLKALFNTKQAPAKPTATQFLPLNEAKEVVDEWKKEAERQGQTGINSDKTVISLFDASGEWSKPWAEAGFNVVTYDLQTGQDIREFDAQMLLEEHGNDNVWAVLAAPPCTDYASSGARYWKSKDADGRTEISNELVRQVLRTVELLRPAVWAMENPVGRMAKVNNLPPAQLTFQPNLYGDPYTKKTLLWGNFNNKLPQAPVEPTEGSKIIKISSGNKYERSLTPEGFAYSFFSANNPVNMTQEERLSREFHGISGEEFRGAGEEREIRNKIQDAYFDNDLDLVRELLKTKQPARKSDEGLEKAREKAAVGPSLFEEEEAGSDIAEIKKNMVRYASGMSAISDLREGAYARSKYKNFGIGVDVSLLSEPAMNVLAEAVLNLKTPVFVDSGAFGAFRKQLKGEPTKPLDFKEVLEKYDSILKKISDLNEVEDVDYPRPKFVMPDVIGDQQTSINLIRNNKKWITAELDFNLSDPIVPIQGGEKSLSQVFDELTEILGGRKFIVGIPSQEAAISREELAAFLEKSKPERVHFLGAASDKRLNPLLALVAKHSPKTRVSADASQIRSKILNAVQGGKSRKEAIQDSLREEADGYEVLEAYMSARQEEVKEKAPKPKYEIQRKESYRGRTTPDVTYQVLQDGKMLREYNRKKDAQQYLDILTLSKEEVEKKYPELKAPTEEAAIDPEAVKNTIDAYVAEIRQTTSNFAPVDYDEANNTLTYVETWKADKKIPREDFDELVAGAKKSDTAQGAKYSILVKNTPTESLLLAFKPRGLKPTQRFVEVFMQMQEITQEKPERTYKEEIEFRLNEKKLNDPETSKKIQEARGVSKPVADAYVEAMKKDVVALADWTYGKGSEEDWVKIRREVNKIEDRIQEIEKRKEKAAGPTITGMQAEIDRLKAEAKARGVELAPLAAVSDTSKQKQAEKKEKERAKRVKQNIRSSIEYARFDDIDSNPIQATPEQLKMAEELAAKVNGELVFFDKDLNLGLVVVKNNFGFEDYVPIHGGKISKVDVASYTGLSIADKSFLNRISRSIRVLRETSGKMLDGTEKETASVRSVAEQFAGVPVYYDRVKNIGLVRGYNALTGAPVYIPVIGDRYVGRDVESTNVGEVLPYKAELIAVKNRLEKQAEQAHKDDPFIKFENGVAMSENMDPKIAGIVREWKKMLNLDGVNVYFSTIEDAKENRANFTGPQRVIGSGTLDANELGSMRRMADGSYYVLFKKTSSTSATLERIAHEMGHIHEREAYENASPELKKKLQDAHARWLQQRKGKTAREAVNMLRAKSTAQITTIASGKKMAADLSPYWSSFSEWYADQVSRWAVTDEKPVSVVEKFFAKLGRALRKFYNTLRGRNFLPDETFVQYLNEVKPKIVDSKIGVGPGAPQGELAFKMTRDTKDDEELVRRYRRANTPMLEHAPTKRALINSVAFSKNMFKEMVNSPTTSLSMMFNSLNRGIMYLRNKNVWFGSGINEADRIRYSGQVRTAENLATASLALDNMIRGGNIASQVVFLGGIKFNPKSLTYGAVETDTSMVNVYKAEAEIKKRLGEQLGTNIIQGYLEAKRSKSIKDELADRQQQIVELNEQIDAMVKLARATEANPAATAEQRKQIDRALRILFREFDEAQKDLQVIQEVAEDKVTMSDKEISDFIAREKVHPELRTIIDNFNGVNQGQLRFWREVGLLSEARYKRLAAIKDYVPWQRIMNDEADVHSPLQATTKSATNIGKERLFKSGRPSVINDFVVEAGQDVFRIQPSRVNRVKLNGTRLDPKDYTVSQDGEIRIKVPYKPGDVVVIETQREIENMIDNMTRNVMRMTMNGLRQYAANRIVSEYATRDSDNKIMTFPKVDKEKGRFDYIADGRRVVVEIQDPLIAEGALGMEAVGMKMWEPLAAAANLTRRTITSSPIFQLKQVFKDAPTAALVTGVKNPHMLIGGVYSSFISAVRKSDPAGEILRRQGIGGFYSPARTPEAEVKREIGIINKNALDYAMKALDHWGDSSDMAQRIAVYNRVMKESNGDEALALYQAANVINFLRHGSGQVSQALFKTVPFLNAYAQSIDVLYDALRGGGLRGKDRKAALQALAWTGSLLAGMTILYTFLVGDDEDYLKLDDQSKVRNIMLPGTQVVLPMNTSAAFFFKAIPELITNKVINEGTDNEVDAKRLRTALKEAAIDMLLGPNPTPSAVKPFIEIGLNRNFFTSRDITPKSLQDLDAYEQYDIRTSEAAKLLSGLTGTKETRLLNPMEADHLVRSIFGTAGAMVAWASNFIGESAEYRPEMGLKEMPVTGAFMRPDVPRGREDLLYKLKESTDKKYNTFERLAESGRLDEAEKYLEKYPNLIAYRDYTSEMASELKEINAAIRFIGMTRDKSYTPEQKRKDILELLNAKQDILEGVEQFRKEAYSD